MDSVAASIYSGRLIQISDCRINVVGHEYASMFDSSLMSQREICMANSRNWEKFNRNSRAAAARDRPRGGPSVRQTFEALAHYLSFNEPEGGNFVVVPFRWESMTDVDLYQLRVAHRRRTCAENTDWFDYSAGDRWVRIRDETVEMLNIRNCEVCAAHVRRN